MKNLIFIVFISVIFNQCSLINPCDGIACTSPPPTYYLNIVDKDTGDNLYLNNTLNPDNLSLTDTNGKRFAYEYINEDNLNIVKISSIGWNTGAHHYTLTVSEDISISIDLDIDNVYEDCCDFFRVNNFNVNDFSFARDSKNGIITIKI